MNIVITDGQYRFYNNIKIVGDLERGVYLLRYDRMGCFLEKTQDLELPKKIYDVDGDFRKVVLKSFDNHAGNTGVLLEGYKGQGERLF